MGQWPVPRPWSAPRRSCPTASTAARTAGGTDATAAEPISTLADEMGPRREQRLPGRHVPGRAGTSEEDAMSQSHLLHHRHQISCQFAMIRHAMTSALDEEVADERGRPQSAPDSPEDVRRRRQQDARRVRARLEPHWPSDPAGRCAERPARPHRRCRFRESEHVRRPDPDPELHASPNGACATTGSMSPRCARRRVQLC